MPEPKRQRQLAAGTPNTAVRAAGRLTPKRDLTHAGSSSTKNRSWAANRAGSKPGEYSCSRAISSDSRCAPTIIVGGAPASDTPSPQGAINCPSPAKITASAAAAGT